MHVSNNCPTNVYYVDVAIKSYATSTLTGITFDGFIDCTLEKFTGLIDEWLSFRLAIYLIRFVYKRVG